MTSCFILKTIMCLSVQLSPLPSRHLIPDCFHLFPVTPTVYSLCLPLSSAVDWNNLSSTSVESVKVVFVCFLWEWFLFFDMFHSSCYPPVLSISGSFFKPFSFLHQECCLVFSSLAELLLNWTSGWTSDLEYGDGSPEQCAEPRCSRWWRLLKEPGGSILRCFAVLCIIM